MDIKAFKTFVAVAECRHFGRAAQQLYITQAAVSARIKQLEEFYATPLFIREKNNLLMTPAGESLLPYAHLVIDHINQSKASVESASQQKSRFNIAATPNIWDAYISSRVKNINHIFDGKVVGTEISVREAIQRKLEEKSLSLAFLTDPLKESEFRNILINYFDIVLVGTNAKFNESSTGYVYVDWGIAFSKEHATTHKFRPSHQTTTAAIALELILSQGGFAYLPAELVAPYLASKELFPLESTLQIKRPIYLTYLKNHPDLSSIDTLVSFLTASQ